MKRVISLSIFILLLSFVPLSVLAETSSELTPENTVILSNETDKSFCQDFSAYLKKLSINWLSVGEFERIKDKNIIILGGPDAKDVGEIVIDLLTWKEVNYIRKDGNYSILKKDSPWTDNKVVYILAGSDRVLTKRAAEEGIRSILEKVKNREKWFDYSFSSCSLGKAQKYIGKFQFVPDDEELPEDELSIELNAKTDQISKQEAREDVEYLFYLLSHGYSGYGYFKTKGDFDQAKKDILSELDTYSYSTLSPKYFSELIYKHLNFIHDGHFRVGYNKYFQHKDFWYDKNFEIWKTGGEYYFISDNKKWTILKVNGRYPEKHIFPSLNSQGEPIYRLGILSQSAPDPLILRAKDEDENEKTFEIKLYQSSFKSKGIFEESTRSGIPIISIRSFSDSHIDDLEKFLQTAEKYRSEPYIILDIRGNRGGNCEWPRKWIEKFTGENPQWYYISTTFFSRTTLMGKINLNKQYLERYPDNEVYKRMLKQYEEQLDDFERKSHTPYWSELSFPNFQMIPNSTKLIVLTDERIYSAGEDFIGYLRQVENVTFVGENSGGCIVFGDITLHQLPNSKLNLYLPYKLFFPADLKNIVEEGFHPDLWVPADRALEYVLEAIEKGTI